MKETQRWQALLTRSIALPTHKKQLARELGVHQMTLQRWSTGESAPTRHHLQQLFTLFPEQRPLLHEAFPTLFPCDENPPIQELPATVYAQILTAWANLPRSLHPSSLCALILEQALALLDPARQGLVVACVHCLRPISGTLVQSLQTRLMLKRTSIRHQEIPHETLLGANSCEGRAVTFVRPFLMQNEEEQPDPFNALSPPSSPYTVAVPIHQGELVAGAFSISRSPSAVISPSQFPLLQQVALLLALTFEREDFYAPEAIQLRVMPSQHLQMAASLTLHERITRLLLGSSGPSFLSLAQAELLAWQQMEQDYLHLLDKQEK
ncbi:MAG TPA: helix-turn-helix transcriptional regulator [Ktedonobacteraceae bacterium]|nr:helix-turn-helix transcriptional regulator [Ktedonobacteraceae bacterium]